MSLLPLILSGFSLGFSIGAFVYTARAWKRQSECLDRAETEMEEIINATALMIRELQKRRTILDNASNKSPEGP